MNVQTEIQSKSFEPVKGMRIRRVRIHKLAGPLRERFGWSLNWTRARTATVVEVTTDCGITGWGDGAAAEEILRSRPEIVIGRSPFEVEGIFEDLRAAPGKQERPGSARCGGLGPNDVTPGGGMVKPSPRCSTGMRSRRAARIAVGACSAMTASAPAVRSKSRQARTRVASDAGLP